MSSTAGAQALQESADPDGYDVDVTNNSWGGYNYSQTVRNALNYAARMNRIVAAAKGNDNTDDRHYPSDYNQYHGDGLVKADRALARLHDPWTLNRYTATGGTVSGSPERYRTIVSSSFGLSELRQEWRIS